MNTAIRNQFDGSIEEEVEFEKLKRLAQQTVICDIAYDGRIIGLKYEDTERNRAFAGRFKKHVFERPRSLGELLTRKPRMRFKIVWTPNDGRFRFRQL